MMSRVKFLTKSFIFSLLLSVFAYQITVAQSVSLEAVDGTISATRLHTNQLITFNIRLNNNSGLDV